MLYIWTQNPNDWTPEQHEIIAQKARYYLNTTFFIVRYVIYFVTWILLSTLLNNCSSSGNGNGAFLVRSSS